MFKSQLSIALVAVVLMALSIESTEEDQFDTSAVYSSADLLIPDSELVRYKFPRASEWCQYIARAYPQMWPRLRADMGGVRKRGYMGIEIPDFITSQDGNLQGGATATGSKPRYFKNG